MCMLWLCRKSASSALLEIIPSTFSCSMFSVKMGFVDGLVCVGRVGEGGVGGGGVDGDGEGDGGGVLFEFGVISEGVWCGVGGVCVGICRWAVGGCGPVGRLMGGVGRGCEVGGGVAWVVIGGCGDWCTLGLGPLLVVSGVAWLDVSYFRLKKRHFYTSEGEYYVIRPIYVICSD